MEMNTITQKLTAITGRLARLTPVSVAAPLDALRKVPGGWETTEAIVLEEITGREAIAQ